MPETIADRFRAAEKDLNTVVIERADEVHTLYLALATHQHHHCVGPPGSGKSHLVDQAVGRISGIALRDGYFKQQLTPFSPPEELVGSLDLEALDNNQFRHDTTGMLPRARIAFTDELFKATSVLQVLLSILNERLFFNGADNPNIPLLTCFSASNEIPPPGELMALWDRLPFRLMSRPTSDAGWRTLMRSNYSNPEPIIDISEIEAAKEQVLAVDFPEQVLEALFTVRSELATKGVHPSDRRWKLCRDVVKAEAWMAGRDQAIIDDLNPLRFVLWTDPENINTVSTTVLTVADPVEAAAQEIRALLTAARAEYDRDMKGDLSTNERGGVTVTYYNKLTKAKRDVTKLRAKIEASGRDETATLQALKLQVNEGLETASGMSGDDD